MIVQDKTVGSISPASRSCLFRAPKRPQHHPCERRRRRPHHVRQLLCRSGRAAFWGTSSPAALHHNPQLLQQSAALPTSLLAAAAVPTATTSTVGFFKLLTAFLLGGLFCSTALAAVSACYAVGLQNVKVLWDILKAVLQAVWMSFTAALGSAKAALLLSSDRAQRASWQWKAAWQVLKSELSKTRQTAVEGVAALRQEAALYAGAVGAPGLIPIQYLVDQFLPYSISGALEKSLREALQEIPATTRSIQKMKLTSFDIGSQPPQFQAARVYELGGQAVAYDVDVDWPSEMEIKLTVSTAAGLARIPVVVKNIQFRGVVRLILTPLMAESPGFGAALVSLPKAPVVNLDVRVAGGDITRIPWLRSELVGAIQKAIATELLWPKRTVIPSMVPTTGIAGLNEKPLLSKDQLAALAKTDPLLRREQVLAESPMLRKQYEQPQLSSLKQKFKVFVNRPENENDNDKNNGDDSAVSSPSLTVDPMSDKLQHQESSPTNRHHSGSVDRRRLAEIQTGVLWKGLFQKAAKNGVLEH